MARLFVRHDVADFDRWRSGYDDAERAGLRRELGVRADGVYQAADRSTDVTVWHDFDSVEAARSFVSDPRLAAAMADLGVTGEPQIWITTEA
jgi:hypothetical protein